MALSFVPLYEGKNFQRWMDDWMKDPDEPRPDPSDFAPCWTEDEADGWCVYETVSEGTPVTPVFATPEELVDYLVEHGDFWDQKRRVEQRPGEGFYMPCDPWDRASAERFVMGSGWFPSAVTVDGQYFTAANAAEMPE